MKEINKQNSNQKLNADDGLNGDSENNKLNIDSRNNKQASMTRANFKISGMHCASCATIISKALLKTPGVVSANVNFSSEKAAVVLSK
ncbi:heavy-metal-associated domain-containing protein [Candidatus Woesearchaeota archaeon]|nr:heavy-metal-associated domain-containing protein [Candidatus Woesearchaeota archaeon]